MTIDQIDLNQIETAALSAQLASNQFEKPSSNQWKVLFENVIQAAKDNRCKAALNGLTAAVFFDPKKTFTYISQKGLFRYYQQTEGSCIIPSLAAGLKQICISFGLLTTERSGYLDAVVAIAPFHSIYSQTESRLRLFVEDFIRQYPGRSFVKTVLVYADFLFFTQHEPTVGETTRNVDSRSIENLCSGVSYLVYFYTSRFTSSPSLAAENYISSGDIDEVLSLACNYNDLREYEILIEHFGYLCHKEDNKIIIRPPFPGLEKSIRLGYIRSEIQSINDIIKSDMPPALSLVELTESIIASTGSDLFKKVEDKGIPRYTLSLTEKAVNSITKNFIEPNEVFFEEGQYIGMVIKEQLLRADELLKIPFKDNLTLFEFLKARRWFLFLGLLFSKYAEVHDDIDINTILRTLVPQFTADNLHLLLDRIMTPDKVNTFLSIISWSPNDSYLFDLQYQPLVNLNSHYEVPLYVFSYSNAVRNLYAAQYKQNNKTLMKDGHSDPLVEKLISIFRSSGVTPFKNISIGTTDVDVCCAYGKTLYVFECKHTLHPVSVFDLRTMYDYIRHAQDQLTLIEGAFRDGSLIKTLEKSGMNCDNIQEISPCIVTSNRLLNGSAFRFPVRYINEIDNILLKGEIRTASGIYCIWPEERLTPEYIRTYFSHDDSLTQMHFDCLSPKTIRHEVFGHIVEFRTFSMLMNKANPIVENYVSRLKKLKDHESKPES